MRVALLSLFAVSCAAHNASPSQRPSDPADTVELAQSFPAETTLADPSLRTAREVWLEMIRGATRTIDIEQFYVASKPGESLEAVLDALNSAGRRGVRVRLIVSKMLAHEDPATLDRIRRIPGALVRILDLKPLVGGIQHAKLWVVDGRLAFVGSQNLDWRSLTHILELGVRVSEPEIIRQLSEIFEVDWELALRPTDRPAWPAVTRPRLTGQPIELVASPPGITPPAIRPALDALLDLVRHARRRIRFQLLSYSIVGRAKGTTWRVIDDALRDAAKRGVKIDIIVSDWNTTRTDLPTLRALSAVPNVTLKVASIPQTARGFIPFARVVHSKFMVVDDAILWLGTSNWSEKYFTASRNVELIFRRVDLATKANEIFERLGRSPYAAPFDPAKDYVPPRRASAALLSRPSLYPSLVSFRALTQKTSTSFSPLFRASTAAESRSPPRAPSDSPRPLP